MSDFTFDDLDDEREVQAFIREERATELIDDEERTLGITAGEWARENVPADLDLRDGQPAIDDVLSHSPEWASGYVEGAKVEPELPDWAQDRADKGLCAVINDWCVTHARAMDAGHGFYDRPGRPADFDYGD